VSYSATGSDRQEAGVGRRHNALVVLLTLIVAAIILARVYLTDEMMNELYEYTTKFGAFYEKVHLGTYLILLMVPVALFSRPVYLEGHDISRFRDLVRFCGLILLLIAFLVVMRRMSAGGLFVDTYLVAGAAGLIVLSLPPDGRRFVGNAVLIVSLASALVGMPRARVSCPANWSS
jgi:hypothetical protein